MPDRPETFEQLKASLSSGLTASLGIELIESSESGTTARIHVDSRTTQPFGLLHGGALAALAETIASVGGLVFVDFPRQVVVGQQVSMNLLRPSTEGYVVGIGNPIHKGATSQLWDIEMRGQESGKLVATARVLLAVVKR